MKKIKLLPAIGLICSIGIKLVLAAFAIYVILYYPRKAESFEINTIEPSEKMLIVTQSSDFKDTLTKTLCDSLKKSSVYIRGIDVGKLVEVRDEDWDRIVIINSFVIELNKDVDRFLTRALSPKKVLMFITSGGADWLPQPELKVDAITSASKTEYIDDVVHLITDWMGKANEQNWEPDDHVLALKYMPRVDVNAACEAIVSDPKRYQTLHPNLDVMINRIGYQFLRVKKIKAALKVFKLNKNLFPDSWNVYDSYGEALLMDGDRASAISNYRKAAQLNPESKSANRMLEKLTKQ